MSKSIMIDLETLDLNNTAKILSIGAVEFFDDEYQTIEDIMQDAFYMNVDTESYADTPYFTESKETREWWAAQSKDSIKVLEKDQEDIFRAIYKLRDWINIRKTNETLFYAYSPYFDISILNSHYDFFRVTKPWGYKDIRDMRTSKDIFKRLGIIDFKLPNNLVAHNSLHDAASQAYMIQRWNKCFKSLSPDRNY
jgi:hypothetical protein